MELIDCSSGHVAHYSYEKFLNGQHTSGDMLGSGFEAAILDKVALQVMPLPLS